MSREEVPYSQAEIDAQLIPVSCTHIHIQAISLFGPINSQQFNSLLCCHNSFTSKCLKFEVPKVPKIQ